MEQKNEFSAQPAILMEGIVKRYGSGSTAVEALKGVDMVVYPSEVVGLIGPSGSGKTTLLQCLGAVIEPTSGRITLGGRVTYDNGWRVKDLRALRRDSIGFIFQAPYLISFLNALDNVALLPMLAGQPAAKARQRALELLDVLDMAHRSHAKVSQLSGGEQQRVAIARALANKPPIMLADEPTAPLDSQRALIVMKLLKNLARQYQTAIIVVTHDDAIIPTFRRIYRIRDGRAYEEKGEGYSPVKTSSAGPVM
jgi:putative ABC transport system ATP-binding protein